MSKYISNIFSVSDPNHSLFSIKDSTSISTPTLIEDKYGDDPIEQTTNDELIPTKIDSTFFKKISAGGFISGALNENGYLYLWGYNKICNKKQVCSKPIKFKNTNYKDISCGKDFALAVDTSNYVWGIGNNYNGQLGTGDLNDRNHPIKLDENVGTYKPNINLFHRCLNSFISIDELGRVYFSGTPNNSYATGVGICLKRTTLMFTKSSTFIGKPIKIVETPNTLQVLTDSNRIYACGSNYSYEMMNKATNNGFTYLTTSAEDIGPCCYIDTNGNLYKWGYNNNYQIGDGTTVAKSNPTHISFSNKVIQVTGNDLNTVCVCEDNSLWAWGSSTDYGIGGNTPQKQTIEFIPKQITIGTGYMLAIDENGHLWHAGHSNYSGQTEFGLTCGVSVTSSSFTKIVSNINFKQIRVDGTYSDGAVFTGLDVNGRVWCWGHTQYGKCGLTHHTDTTSFISVPTMLKIPKKIISLPTHGYYSCALDVDGNLWHWGRNSSGGSSVVDQRIDGTLDTYEDGNDAMILRINPKKYRTND